MSLRGAWGSAVALVMALGAGDARAGWNRFHGNAAHTGSSASGVPSDPIVAWTQDGPDSIVYSSPVIDDHGAVYIGTLGSRLLAFAPNGTPRWSYVAGGNFRHSTPAVGPTGTIYIGDTNGVLHAVNRDGSAAWTFTASASIKTSPNVAADGTIYFGTDDGKLYALWPAGTLRWSFTAGDSIRSSPAIGPDGTILFGCEDHFLYAVWPNGTLRWKAATGDRIKYSSPAASPTGRVYVGSYDRFLYAFDANGVFLWAFYTNNPIRSSPAIGSDGTIYVGSGDHLFAILPTGAQKWQYTATGEIQSSPAFSQASDDVCVGDDGGVLHVLHAADANVDWTAQLGGMIRSSPAIGGNDLYIGDANGKLWAFGAMPTLGVDPPSTKEPGSGLRAWPNPARRAVTFQAPAGSRSQGGNGWVDVLDTSGRRVASLPIGGDGKALWSGTDATGRPVPAGIFLFRLRGSGRTGRLALIRDGGGAR